MGMGWKREREREREEEMEGGALMDVCVLGCKTGANSGGTRIEGKAWAKEGSSQASQVCFHVISGNGLFVFISVVVVVVSSHSSLSLATDIWQGHLRSGKMRQQ